MTSEHLALYTRAKDAATSAIAARFSSGSRERPGYTGTASVTIRGGTSFARWTAKHSLTHLGWPAGRTFHCPGDWPPGTHRQDIDFHLAAARAFAAVLREAGVPATINARLD